jgi:hypothetical protein
MNAITTIDTAAARADFFTRPYQLTIGGKLVKAKNTFDVINPATGRVLAQAPERDGRATQRRNRSGQDRFQKLVGSHL